MLGQWSTFVEERLGDKRTSDVVVDVDNMGEGMGRGKDAPAIEAAASRIMQASGEGGRAQI